ncbi:hypothetical protein J6590_086667 [Homalodisca vitripennis]|nr:hypothetical protein J6590_086667 [Homalodisca vitripennis]
MFERRLKQQKINHVTVAREEAGMLQEESKKCLPVAVGPLDYTFRGLHRICLLFLFHSSSVVSLLLR